jgi:hypothetical protein
MVAEMPSHLGIVGPGPPVLVGSGETGDYPAQLRQRVTFLLGLFAAELQPRPAGQAMLPGDSRLRVVQRGKLASGQAAFRL